MGLGHTEGRRYLDGIFTLLGVSEVRVPLPLDRHLVILGEESRGGHGGKFNRGFIFSFRQN